MTHGKERVLGMGSRGDRGRGECVIGKGRGRR